MSLSPELRLYAQERYLARWPVSRIAADLGVGAATIKRWVRQYGWRELRGLQEQLEREAAALVVEMTAAARSSRDPQQAYAAAAAAELARPRQRPDPGPKPIEVAELLLDALTNDPELGPAVRRRRAAVLEVVTRELERLGPGGSPVGPNP